MIYGNNNKRIYDDNLAIYNRFKKNATNAHTSYNVTLQNGVLVPVDKFSGTRDDHVDTRCNARPFVHSSSPYLYIFVYSASLYFAPFVPKRLNGSLCASSQSAKKHPR